MTDEHDHYRQWAAAYVLGALESEDRRAFEHHLAECDACGAEVSAFAPLPGLMARIDRAELVETADLARADTLGVAAQRVHEELVASRRRWRLASLVGVGAAAAVLVVAFVTTADRDPAPPTVSPARIIDSQADTAMVTAGTRGWGTEITLELTGLPRRDTYQLWTVDDGGGWSLASTWGPTPSGAAFVTGATATPTDDLERVVVTSTDRTDVLVDAAP